MKVKFTTQADTDIIDCYLYGFRNFGHDQAARYEQGLRDAIEIIADSPRIAAERLKYAPVRLHHHAKRYISI